MYKNVKKIKKDQEQIIKYFRKFLTAPVILQIK